MLKNLFVVRSPLQLLNAIEAREAFNCENTVLLLMFNTNQKNTQQMRDLYIEKDWGELIEYDLKFIPRWKRLVAQILLVKMLKKQSYQYLFSGDFGTINQIIMANCHSEEAYILDDGTTTIFTHKKLAAQNYLSNLSFGKRLKLYRYVIAGLKFYIKQPLHFFTVYNLVTNHNEKIINHSFEFLRANQLQQNVNKDVMYLLGQSLVDGQWMSDESYLNYIKLIIARYPQDIIYIPHRSEAVTPQLMALENEHFRIQASTGPIEITMLNSDAYPSTIVSFCSAALFNLSKIYTQTKIDAIKIEPKDLLKSQDVVKKLYDFFEGTRVEVISIKQGSESTSSSHN
jgi:hypothetical protein